MAYRVIEYWNGGMNARGIGGRIETLEEAIEVAKTSKGYGQGTATFGEEGVMITNNNGRKIIMDF